MSSSNATLAELNAVNYALLMFHQSWAYFLISLGTVGHTLNLYVFTRPTLRSNPCVCYFLAATISGIFVTYGNVLLRFLQIVYPAYNPFGISNAACKFFSFITFCARANTTWFIVLASIDRFLCSSPSGAMRAWSNLRVAIRTISLVILCTAICYIYVLVQFEIKPVANKCPSGQGPFPLFSGIWSLLTFSLVPSVLMFIFGSLTIRHVQQSIKRIASLNIQVQPVIGLAPSATDQPRRPKMNDRQFIRMMLVQCIFFSVTSIPVSVYWIYYSLTINVVTDALVNAKINLFGNIATNVSITGACGSFYLFTLSSQLFRREIIQICKRHQRLNQVTNTNTLALIQKTNVTVGRVPGRNPAFSPKL